VVTLYTTRFNIHKSYVLPTQRIYVFCVDLRTNSDYCTIQRWPTGFYNWDGVCLLRGTDWMLKCNLDWCQSLKSWTGFLFTVQCRISLSIFLIFSNCDGHQLMVVRSETLEVEPHRGDTAVRLSWRSGLMSVMLCTARNALQAPFFQLPPAHNLHLCISPDFRWHCAALQLFESSVAK